MVDVFNLYESQMCPQRLGLKVRQWGRSVLILNVPVTWKRAESISLNIPFKVHVTPNLHLQGNHGARLPTLFTF